MPKLTASLAVRVAGVACKEIENVGFLISKVILEMTGDRKQGHKGPDINELAGILDEALRSNNNAANWLNDLDSKYWLNDLDSK